jgi:pentatricopeptide repeat protein
MELSRRKKLVEALSLYWDESNKRIRDAHHAFIVVDCCARCGDVQKAQAVLEAIPSDEVTIELQTALIKGYAHAGDLHCAMRVFRSLFPTENDQKRRPDTSSYEAVATLLCQALLIVEADRVIYATIQNTYQRESIDQIG